MVLATVAVHPTRMYVAKVASPIQISTILLLIMELQPLSRDGLAVLRMSPRLLQGVQLGALGL